LISKRRSRRSRNARQRLESGQGDTALWPYLCNNIGFLEQRTDNVQKALGWYERALSNAASEKDPVVIVTLMNIGCILVHHDRTRAATIFQRIRDLTSEATSARGGADLSGWRLGATMNLAAICGAEDDLLSALRLYREGFGLVVGTQIQIGPESRLQFRATLDELSSTVTGNARRCLDAVRDPE
jgi:hypothetical protein